jgi:hypothetical protein
MEEEEDMDDEDDGEDDGEDEGEDLETVADVSVAAE